MKNILFVTYDFPYPTNTGGKNRAYHMLKYSKGDFKKYLFSFVRADFKEEYKKELGKIGVEVVGIENRTKIRDPKNILGLLSGKSIFKTLYYSSSVDRKLNRLVTDLKIDIVHFESFYTAFYLCDSLRDAKVKQIYSSENIEFRLYEEFAKGKFLKPLFDIQVGKVKSEEINIYKKADRTLAVTEEEVKFIKEYSDKVSQIPNGIDIEDFKFNPPTKREGKNILFVGNFTYFPNVEAINSFYDDVFGSLPQNIELTVVGKGVSKQKFVSDPRVHSIEFIPDIKDVYEQADMLISPILTGGGTNFKVIESMASGTPVIIYGDRAEALGLEDSKHVLIAKNSLDFKEKIELLLGDLPLRQKLAKNARALVEAKYTWQNIGKDLGMVWNNL